MKAQLFDWLLTETVNIQTQHMMPSFVHQLNTDRLCCMTRMPVTKWTRVCGVRMYTVTLSNINHPVYNLLSDSAVTVASSVNSCSPNRSKRCFCFAAYSCTIHSRTEQLHRRFKTILTSNICNFSNLFRCITFIFRQKKQTTQTLLWIKLKQLSCISFVSPSTFLQPSSALLLVIGLAANTTQCDNAKQAMSSQTLQEL